MIGLCRFVRRAAARIFVVLALAAATGGAALAQSSGPASAPAAKVDASLAAVRDCAALAKTDFTNIPGAAASIASAEIVPAAKGTNEYCSVKGIVQPQIAFEVRLPTKTWNGRYFQVGCGFFCGVVDINACSDALARDFAVAAHNMGHAGVSSSDAIWGSDPALREDFAGRSTHVVSVVSKAIVAAYYGARPAYAYYRGCSTGGREGLSEVQRYPTDFDGVIAGDPAFPSRQGGIANVWDTRQLIRKDGSVVFTPAKLKLLNTAVLAQCDALDGLKDGILTDPRVCRFDVRKMQCKSGDRADCLTAEQVASAVKLYAGPQDSKGTKLVPGHRMFGSEMAWESGTRAPIADGFLRFLAFEKNPPPGYTVWDFDFDKDSPKLEAMAVIYDPVAPFKAPDLTAFEAAGGKLILYHGYADPTVSPLNTIDYYAQVTSRQGGLAKVQTWARLFMIPGMFHCRGGDAPNTFDMLDYMVKWVEKGEAPDRIVTSQLVDGKVSRTRPAFPYPQAPRYKGSGDVNDQASFVPVAPKSVADDRIDWQWGPR